MNGENKEMPFLQHLGELRTCLVRSAIAIALCSAVTLFFSTELFIFLKRPIDLHFAGAQLIGTGPSEAFVAKLKLGLAAGFLLALPALFYELWKFILPGLHDHERKLAIPFISAATVFFLIGVFFCYLVVIPFAFVFFADEFMSVGLTPQIRMSEYLSFIVTLTLVFGVMFEMPLLAYVLARFGLITEQWLRDKFRYAVVIIFIVAAILTPPDVVTQLMLAFPLTGLYGLCIVVARYAAKADTGDLNAWKDVGSKIPSGSN